MSFVHYAVEPRILRDYQHEARDAVLAAWGSDETRVAVVLPTGSGKSTVIAAVALEAAKLGLSVVMLAHRGELLDQMALAVAQVDPAAPPVGIVRGARDESDAQIVAATLQTLTSDHRRLRIGERRVILWDEVHHIGADTWHNVLVELGGYQPGNFMAGFTATLRREDGKVLRNSIQRVVYERSLLWAIEQGYLVSPTGLTVKIPDLDLAGVKTVAGDFQQTELAEVMEAATESVVDAITRFAGDRRPIVFAASVDGAHAIADELTVRGFDAEAVDGSMSVEDRTPIYDRYRSGVTRMLVTVQILTEGADFPMCDCAVIARPTQSQVLYSQMVGRALRLYPGKADALVLDLVGTARVLKLVTVTDLDAGIPTRNVDPDGNELAPDEDDEITEAAAPVGKLMRQGPIDMVEIDLLSSTETGILWLQTVKGIPFMPCEDLFVFLWPVGIAGTYFRPGWMTAKGAREGGWIGEQYVEVAQARDMAEDWLIDNDRPLPRRKASWRRDQPPSEKQLNFARMIGVPDTELMTRARLSDEISIVLAHRRLDKAL